MKVQLEEYLKIEQILMNHLEEKAKIYDAQRTIAKDPRGSS